MEKFSEGLYVASADGNRREMQVWLCLLPGVKCKLVEDRAILVHPDGQPLVVDVVTKEAHTLLLGQA